jgi:hypothetical protein
VQDDVDADTRTVHPRRANHPNFARAAAEQGPKPSRINPIGVATRKSELASINGGI